MPATLSDNPKVEVGTLTAVIKRLQMALIHLEAMGAIPDTSYSRFENAEKSLAKDCIRNGILQLQDAIQDAEIRQCQEEKKMEEYYAAEDGKLVVVKDGVSFVVKDGIHAYGAEDET